MSDKPLADRLQLKAGRRLTVLEAPPTIDAAIGAAPQRAPLSEADIVLVFTPDRAALDAALPRVLPELRADVILWVAYPKRTSSLSRDLDRDVIRNAAPAHGLDTVAQIAVDADWSALRLKRVV